MKPPYIDYDGQSQAAYVLLRQRHDGTPFKSVELDDNRLIDLDTQGRIAGVELLSVTVDQVPTIPLLALQAMADYVNA